MTCKNESRTRLPNIKDKNCAYKKPSPEYLKVAIIPCL